MASNRRAFLRALGTAAAAAAFPESISRALAVPANNRTGTIQDIEHVVILMQENRAFDHYFGSLRGVRGFGDPRPVSLPSGKPVWYQPNGGGTLLPFHPTANDLGLQFLEDTPHGWSDTHAAWNGGKYDQWVPNKGTSTMAYLTRNDVPFHYALADAFTICDGYHCSLLGPTDPNRYHMFTGWVGNDGQGGGPVVDNAEAGYDWSTYPERLVRAGISWKVYQDVGVGLTADGFWGWTADPYIGNYGDNSLLYFHQYQTALPGSPLFRGARQGTNVAHGGAVYDPNGLFRILREDVQANKLPQISWIVAPEAFSEHGNWPANYGAWYTSQVLDALTSNHDLWSKTALFVTYDENDGFFDHIVPPTPPQSATDGKSTVETTNDIFPGSSSYEAGPYGLGVRVPMIVVSPWSKGGWVCSQVFDHTSLIQFLEQRFGTGNPDLIESNITPWHRTVCGDLTSCFDFATPNNARPPLPSTAGYVPPDHLRHDDYVPTPPTSQRLPKQEPGLRHARAIPYRLDVHGAVDVAAGRIGLQFANTGQAGACFQVRAAKTQSGPWTYTVGAGQSLSDSWPGTGPSEKYDLSVFGPNGFLRGFKGRIGADEANVEVTSSYGQGRGINLVIANHGAAPCTVTVESAYSDDTASQTLAPGASFKHHWQLDASYGWYDLLVEVEGDHSFSRRLAGHVETGQDSISDPALGWTHRPFAGDDLA